MKALNRIKSFFTDIEEANKFVSSLNEWQKPTFVKVIDRELDIKHNQTRILGYNVFYYIEEA